MKKERTSTKYSTAKRKGKTDKNRKKGKQENKTKANPSFTPILGL